MYPLDMYISKILIIFLSPGGEVFQNSAEIVEFLKKKFGENNAPQYHIVEIEEAALNEERERDLRRVYKTVQGSSEFHIMIFTPNSKSFRASPRLCLCDHVKLIMGHVPSLILMNYRCRSLTRYPFGATFLLLLHLRLWDKKRRTSSYQLAVM